MPDATAMAGDALVAGTIGELSGVASARCWSIHRDWTLARDRPFVVRIAHASILAPRGLFGDLAVRLGTPVRPLWPPSLIFLAFEAFWIKRVQIRRLAERFPRSQGRSRSCSSRRIWTRKLLSVGSVEQYPPRLFLLEMDWCTLLAML